MSTTAQQPQQPTPKKKAFVKRHRAAIGEFLLIIGGLFAFAWVSYEGTFGPLGSWLNLIALVAFAVTMYGVLAMKKWLWIGGLVVIGLLLLFTGGFSWINLSWLSFEGFNPLPWALSALVIFVMVVGWKAAKKKQLI